MVNTCLCPSASIRVEGGKKEAQVPCSHPQHYETVRHFNGCCPQSQGEIKLASFYHQGLSNREVAGSQSKTGVQA